MIENEKNSPIALLVLAIAIISFQSGSAYATHIFKEIGPIAAAALRQGASAFFLLIFARAWRMNFAAINYRVLLPYGISLGVMNIAFYLSIERIPLGIAVAIEFIGPLVVSIISSRKLSDYLWILLAAIGLYILLPFSKISGNIDILGLIYALIAAIGWGYYIIYGHKIGKIMNELDAVALGMLICAFMSIPLAFIYGVKSQIPIEKWVFYGVALTIFSGAVPYMMEMFAMRRMRRQTISLLMSLDPAFAAISGLVFLGQKLNFYESLAIGLIIFASLGATFYSKPKAIVDEPLI